MIIPSLVVVERMSWAARRGKGKVWLRSIMAVSVCTPYGYGVKLGFTRDLECLKCVLDARRVDKESCEGVRGQ